MTNSTKNYSTDGGNTLVVGGKLVIEADATVEGLSGGTTAWADVTGKPAVIAAGADQAAARTAIGAGTPYTLPAAGTVIGGVKRGVAVANAAAGTEVTTINALLASLKTAGVIA